jgi:magnesium chelatase family protein
VAAKHATTAFADIAWRRASDSWTLWGGKSRLARRLTTILPAMTFTHALETTRLHRVAGLTGDRTAVVMTRPCRAPHHTISDVGRIGGGQVPTPGEVSLAHHGILFLDELPAFKRHVLAGLRQPLKMGVTPIHLPDILALVALAARVVPVQAAVPQRQLGT